MALTIHGALLPNESFTAQWGIQTIKETWLVQVDSPLDNAADVVNQLPAYDGGITPEPTFTIGLSSHPDRSDLILKSCDSCSEHPQAGRPFWYVSVTYETLQWANNSMMEESNRRGNTGRVHKFGTGASPDTTIKYPWNEPVNWSVNTRKVKSTRYVDAAGNRLLHANFLPILEGIDIEIDLEVHQFVWNINWSSFDWVTGFVPYIGKINSSTCFGIAAKHVLCENITAVENYRSQNVDGTNEDVHFATITATFVIDRNTDTPNGYFRDANRRVSAHTLEVINVTLGAVTVKMYLPIVINDRGDYAQSPWPLLPTGLAADYKIMNTYNPETDFKIIDPLYPIQADLAAFVSAYGLVIP